jgi:hypothetical protein
MRIHSNILPKPIPALKLALTGATVGPLVDSLHNQCLLEYQKAMIDIPAPAFGPLPFFSLPEEMMQQSDHFSYLIRTSWYVPPLLGIAYLVLGAVLPSVISRILSPKGTTTIILGQRQKSNSNSSGSTTGSRSTSTMNINEVLVPSLPSMAMSPRSRTITAVLTTAIIIKLSEMLESSSIFPYFESEINTSILFTAALAQWFLLDCTIPSLLTATIVSIGGPLSELPFVANGFWHYLPQASDYYPLKDLNWDGLIFLLGDDYKGLALSSITAPCYFAVTMDAIALARWFSMDDTNNNDG